MRARAYFQAVVWGNVRNNFPHMLKIISLCSATHNMHLERKSDTACEGEYISLQFLFLFFSPTIVSSSGCNISRWKITLKILIIIYLGCLILQFGSQNRTSQFCLQRAMCWISVSLKPLPPSSLPLLPGQLRVFSVAACIGTSHAGN